jgi:hypothetical protein
MRKKLAILVTMLVMLLLAASPAFADTAFTQVDGVASLSESQFFGFDTGAAEVDGVVAVGQSDFFGGSLFGGALF